MAQTFGSANLTRAYLKRVQSSHDFRIFVDVLTMEETLIGTARFLDGQVNINDSDPRRTASLTLAEQDGALSLADAASSSGTALWANRLVRIRHVVNVPPYGEVEATPFVGVPTAISRNSGEVQVELADKSSLAMTGCLPMSFGAGVYAYGAIIAFLRDRTGENRFRIPPSSRRTVRPYSVGWDDSVSPWAVCQQIARAELGQQLIYSCDGYVTLRPVPTTPVVDGGFVTEPPDTSLDFAAVKNFVSVTGGATSKTVGRTTTTTQPTSTATAPVTSTISPEYLKRNGVVRRLPLIVTEDSYTTTAQTQARATGELNANALQEQMRVSIVPLFHLDNDDIVSVHAEGQTRNVVLSTGSIPLGVGSGDADMSVGFKVWASRRATPRIASRVGRTVKVAPPPKSKVKAKTKSRAKHHRRRHK